MDENAKLGTISIIIRRNAGMFGNSHGSIVATNTTFVSVIVDVYFGIVSYIEIYRVGGDAIMITLCGCQGRIVRDNNLTHDFIITSVIAIHVNATAVVSHIPRNCNVRFILEIQAALVIYADAAGALIFFIVLNRNIGAVIQRQCRVPKVAGRDKNPGNLVPVGFNRQRGAILDDNIAIRSANTVIVQSYVVALRINNKGLAAVSRGSGIPCKQ